MREVYWGNGFIITTNDCGEIFVATEEFTGVQLRISAVSELGMNVSYMTGDVYIEPSGFRKILFRRKSR